MTFAVPVPPRSKYFWLKLILAVIAVFSFAIVLFEERMWTWWQQRHVCDSSVYAQQIPKFYQDAMLTESYRVCGQNLTLLYSGITKTPLWVAQYLSAVPEEKTQVIQPELASYHQVYLSEKQLNDQHYATLLALPKTEQQFAPLIKVPFNSPQQAKQWQAIDASLKQLSQSYHQDIYVVTGTDYNAANLTQIAGQIWRPQGFYKAVYIPETGVMGAYYLSQQQNHIEYLSICGLEQKLQMQLFPQLSSEQKRDVYQLPLQQGLDFAWQYAYWDSKSQCDVETLQATAQHSAATDIFVATPWIKRLETAALTLIFTLLDWLLAALSTG